MFSVEFINAETDYRHEQLQRAWGGRRRARRRRPRVSREEPASAVVDAPVARIEETTRATTVSAAV